MNPNQLLETIAAELERARPLTAQVVNHLVGTHGISRDEIGGFLENELPKLEDYEVDLIFAPMFTPTLRDHAVVAELIESHSVPSGDWPELIQQLTSRPTRAHLITEDGNPHVVPLRDVTIGRFVNRLRLDGTISSALLSLINQRPAADRPVLKAVARRAVWSSAGRADILAQCLRSAPGDAAELLKLVETYEPSDATDLRAQIPHWLEVLRQEINDAASAKPFFNERVQDLHGGGRDQRRQDTARIAAKENERAFLERLARVLSA